ncbi:MAG: Ig-like domain-containing protein [Gemmatimonadota bacterium]|nr:Ig-like domain-containing protein [Gemmatimonadota bacterium]
MRARELEIEYDEVISEHPANASSLNDLVLVSPRNGAPRVDWHRSSISIRPSKGFRANTAYTVTVLPGISDLRGNIRRTPTVVTFSTGASIPRTVFSGTMFDWLSGLPVNTGMIEARPVSDTSVVYLTASDSIGHFHLVGVPAGQYLVRGYADPNHNRALDPGEAFDTTRVVLSDTINLEILTFAHDSAGPRLGTVTQTDSVTLRAIFDTPLDPRYPLTVAQFRLTGSDSSRIAVASVAPARPDTTRGTPLLPPVSQSAIPIPNRLPPPTVLPKPTRPLLVRDVIVVLAQPLRPGITYTLAALNAVGPTGRTLSSDRSFTVARRVAKPVAPSPAAAPTRPGARARE